MSSKSKITTAFQRAHARKEAALVVYLTGGFPDLERSMDLARTCAQHGADIIEIGIPFSDPVADGPSIQYSSHSALEKGVTLDSILRAVLALDTDVPFVIMSYLNPILTFGWTRFLDATAGTRIAGLVIPDLPVEEAGHYTIDARDIGLDLILLVAPTSTAERVQRIVDQSRGFVYCVSATGITGVRTILDHGTRAFLARVRAMTETPCAVGFGISGPEHIRMLRDTADGVVVGSRIIEGIRNNENISKLVHDMKESTRR